MRYPLVNPRQWELVCFDKHADHDSIWSLVRGADGHIYIGLGQEYTGGGAAQLYRYNVVRHKLEHCADLADVCGEPASNGHPTQGKIHFSLCAASDGSIYGTTHCTTPPAGHLVWNPYGMWGDPLYNYPGGHVFRYDPATGKTVDFGIVFREEGLPFMVLDEKRSCFYGVTYPKAHFFRMNTVGRGLVDYGRVSSWYPIGMCFDAQMNVFFSDTNSQLIKYDVKQDKLIFLRKTPYANPWNRSMRFSWISNLNPAEDGMIYGTPYCNDHLFRFDPRQDVPEIEDLGPGAPERPSSMMRCLVPDGRGHVYYAVGPRAAASDMQRLFVRYHIRTGQKEVLGETTIGKTVTSSWMGVTDREGNIYMKGGGNPISLVIFHPND